jgi:pilus assembly protein Flp/PilA
VIPANTSPEQDSPMRRFIPKAQILPAKVQHFLPAQDGTTAIEYALIAAGIAGVLIAIVNTIGGQMTTMWTTIASIFG